MAEAASGQRQRLTLAPNPYFTALRAAGTRPEPRYTVLSYDEPALARDLRVPGKKVRFVSCPRVSS